MKRVLFLAYYFPPIGGAGVQRSVKFARYLPAEGYLPVIVTGPGVAAGRWTPQDESLVDELPRDIDVTRVTGPEPPVGDGWDGRLERWAHVEGRWSRWWRQGLDSIATPSEPVDVVYASMSPFETSRSAERLARRLGVPWVADLRDPWALDEMQVYPTAVHRRDELRAMRQALGTARGIVMNTPESAAQVVRLWPHLADRTVSIPNGFDAADFVGQAPDRDDGRFRIVHTGYLHTGGAGRSRLAWLRRTLGGTIGDVDIGTRSHVHLLEATRRLLDRSPHLADVIEIHFAGALTDVDLEAMTLSVVRTHGYLDHAASIALMQSADLLFLPMHDLADGFRSRIVPGKTYEYLAASRPILAAVPDGDARDLLTEAGNAFLTRPADVEGMSTILEDRIRAWQEGRPSPTPDPDVVARYERRRLTAELARLLDEVTAVTVRD